MLMGSCCYNGVGSCFATTLYVRVCYLGECMPCQVYWCLHHRPIHFNLHVIVLQVFWISFDLHSPRTSIRACGSPPNTIIVQDVWWTISDSKELGLNIIHRPMHSL
jgi:hypothetical protein